MSRIFRAWLRPARAVPIALLLGSLLLAIPGGAEAAAIHHHDDITTAALQELGWSDENAIAIVSHCNMATDFARLPGYSRATLDFVMPATGTYVPLVRELGETASFSPRATVGHHFNSLYTYDDIDDAVRRANLEHAYFQAALFTNRLDRALDIGRRLHGMAVMINDHTAFRVDWMPFAGLRQSGLNTGGIPYTFEDMQIEKLLVIRSPAL